MDDLLPEKTAIVTGGASGNGRAIALRFAENGADVVIADVREMPREGGQPTHEKVRRETDSDAQFVECDVSKLADLETAVAVAESFGDVDVMVNNAGIGRSQDISEVTEQKFDEIMGINAKGIFFGSQLAAETMSKTEGGAIVNVASLAGLHGNKDFAVYCASKAAVENMTYSFADAFGPHGIRVNAIHPGVIETAMTQEDDIVGTEHDEEYKQSIPMRRFGTPGDVAEVALFLSSDMARYVNAASIYVDGGMFNTA